MDRIDLLIDQPFIYLSISSLSLEEEEPGKNFSVEEGAIIQCVLTDLLVLTELLTFFFFLPNLPVTQDKLVGYLLLLWILQLFEYQLLSCLLWLVFITPFHFKHSPLPPLPSLWPNSPHDHNFYLNADNFQVLIMGSNTWVPGSALQLPTETSTCLSWKCWQNLSKLIGIFSINLFFP